MLIRSTSFANVFETALRLLASGRIEAGRIVSAVLPLASFPEAMTRAVARDGTIKVQIAP